MRRTREVVIFRQRPVIIHFVDNGKKNASSVMISGNNLEKAVKAFIKSGTGISVKIKK